MLHGQDDACWRLCRSTLGRHGGGDQAGDEGIPFRLFGGRAAVVPVPEHLLHLVHDQQVVGRDTLCVEPFGPVPERLDERVRVGRQPPGQVVHLGGVGVACQDGPGQCLERTVRGSQGQLVPTPGLRRDLAHRERGQQSGPQEGRLADAGGAGDEQRPLAAPGDDPSDEGVDLGRTTEEALDAGRVERCEAGIGALGVAVVGGLAVAVRERIGRCPGGVGGEDDALDAVVRGRLRGGRRLALGAGASRVVEEMADGQQRMPVRGPAVEEVDEVAGERGVVGAAGRVGLLVVVRRGQQQTRPTRPPGERVQPAPCELPAAERQSGEAAVQDDDQGRVPDRLQRAHQLLEPERGVAERRTVVGQPCRVPGHQEKRVVAAPGGLHPVSHVVEEQAARGLPGEALDRFEDVVGTLGVRQPQEPVRGETAPLDQQAGQGVGGAVHRRVVREVGAAVGRGGGHDDRACPLVAQEQLAYGVGRGAHAGLTRRCPRRWSAGSAVVAGPPGPSCPRRRTPSPAAVSARSPRDCRPGGGR